MAKSISRLCRLRPLSKCVRIMCENIEKILSDKVGHLQRQLAALGDGGWVSSGKKAVGRPKGSSLKGKKVAPKYRSQGSKRNLGWPRCETWWMGAAIKTGKKKEDFLIHKGQ
jgi:hypothetical protein